jgi:hypothetical protein
MADQALPCLEGSVLDGIFTGFVAHRTKITPGGDQGDGCLVFFRRGLVAVLTTHPNCGVDKLTLPLLRMAGQARLGLDVLSFNQRMCDRFFSRNLT